MIAFFIVGGVVTGLMRHAVINMDETTPTESNNFWVRAPVILFFYTCLCVDGCFVFRALPIIVHLIGG